MPYKNKEDKLNNNRKYLKNHYNKNKEYYVNKAKKRKEELKLWFNSEYIQGKSCTTCGESDPACFDFHHNDPNDKEGGVFAMVHNGCSKEKIIKEVDKCTLLCANCHRKLHFSKIDGI